MSTEVTIQRLARRGLLGAVAVSGALTGCAGGEDSGVYSNSPEGAECSEETQPSPWVVPVFDSEYIDAGGEAAFKVGVVGREGSPYDIWVRLMVRAIAPADMPDAGDGELILANLYVGQGEYIDQHTSGTFGYTSYRIYITAEESARLAGAPTEDGVRDTDPGP